uniref:Uncharacterized protein n=1 Tax=Panagrolaimus superbus TaxID=310955 RepID=A0A914YD31_9BILA
MVPTNEFYHDLNAFSRIENGNPKTMYLFSLSKSQLKKINDDIFILEKQTKLTEGNRSLRLSRYPLCETSSLKTLSNFGATPLILNDFFESVSSIVCKRIYHSFDTEKQICGRTSDRTEIGTPLVTVINSNSYLAGILNYQQGYVKVYNLMVEKCDAFPKYLSCEYLLNVPSKLISCYSNRISNDLFNSGHPEIVVIGSTENNYNFVPSGFAVIISDNQVIAFSEFVKVLEQTENPQIYGNGEQKNFEGKPFERFQKAKFSFDQTNATNIETLQFNGRKIAFTNESETKNAFKFLWGAPVFGDGKIVAFKENGSYYSVFEMKEFLEKNVKTLLAETTTTTTAKMTIFPKVTATINKTTHQPFSSIKPYSPKITTSTVTVFETSTSESSNSNGVFWNIQIFVLLAFTFFAY